MTDRTPIREKGEAGISINGEVRRLRFSLAAQARIVEILPINTIEELPAYVQEHMDAVTVAKLIYCALIPEDRMSLEDVLESYILLAPATVAIVRAIELGIGGPSSNGPLEEEMSKSDAEVPGPSLKR